MVNVQETEKMAAVRHLLSVYSHTRDGPMETKVEAYVIYIVIGQSYTSIHGLYPLPPDRYTTSANELSITTRSFPPSAFIRALPRTGKQKHSVSIVHYLHSLSHINRILICKSVYGNADVFIYARIEGIPPSAGKRPDSLPSKFFQSQSGGVLHLSASGASLGYMKGRLVSFASHTIPKPYLQIRNNIDSRSTQYVQSVDLCRFCGISDQAFQIRKLCMFDGPLLSDLLTFSTSAEIRRPYRGGSV